MVEERFCSFQDAYDDCGVSIELLYEGTELTKLNREGHRIFLSDEFTEESHQLIENKEIVCLNKTLVDANKRNLVKVVDKEMFDSNEKSLALSKERFAELIYNRGKPFDSMDFSGFESILNVLQKTVTNEPVN